MHRCIESSISSRKKKHSQPKWRQDKKRYEYATVNFVTTLNTQSNPHTHIHSTNNHTKKNRTNANQQQNTKHIYTIFILLASHFFFMHWWAYNLEFVTFRMGRKVIFLNWVENERDKKCVWKRCTDYNLSTCSKFVFFFRFSRHFSIILTTFFNKIRKNIWHISELHKHLKIFVDRHHWSLTLYFIALGHGRWVSRLKWCRKKKYGQRWSRSKSWS